MRKLTLGLPAFLLASTMWAVVCPPSNTALYLIVGSDCMSISSASLQESQLTVTKPIDQHSGELIDQWLREGREAGGLIVPGTEHHSQRAIGLSGVVIQQILQQANPAEETVIFRVQKVDWPGQPAGKAGTARAVAKGGNWRGTAAPTSQPLMMRMAGDQRAIQSVEVRFDEGKRSEIEVAGLKPGTKADTLTLATATAGCNPLEWVLRNVTAGRNIAFSGVELRCGTTVKSGNVPAKYQPASGKS